MTREDCLPERRLMQAVILNAISDAVASNGDSRRPKRIEFDQEIALRWFTEAGPDFEQVCDWAGMHPDMVSRLVLEFVTSNQAIPRMNRSAGTRRRNPQSAASIAARAGVSASAARNVIKHGKGSADMIARVRAAIADLEAENRKAA